MSRRFPDPKLEWDPAIGAYRAIDQASRHVPTGREEKRGAAKASVSQLLLQSFGKTLRSGATVPAHLKPYVK